MLAYRTGRFGRAYIHRSHKRRAAVGRKHRIKIGHPGARCGQCRTPGLPPCQWRRLPLERLRRSSPR